MLSIPQYAERDEKLKKMEEVLYFLTKNKVPEETLKELKKEVRFYRKLQSHVIASFNEFASNIIGDFDGEYYRKNIYYCTLEEFGSPETNEKIYKIPRGVVVYSRVVRDN